MFQNVFNAIIAFLHPFIAMFQAYPVLALLTIGFGVVVILIVLINNRPTKSSISYMHGTGNVPLGSTILGLVAAIAILFAIASYFHWW